MTDPLPTGRTEFELFTTSEAAALGHDRKSLARLRQRKVIEPVCRGVHAHGQAQLSDVETHRRLAHAGLILYPDARLSHATNLVMRKVPVWPTIPERVDLVRPVNHEVLTQSFRIRPLYGDVEDLDGMTLCDVPSTLIRYTMDQGATSGTVAVDYALHEGLVEEEALRAAYQTVRGHPQSARCRSMFGFMDGRRESVGETRLAILALAAGIRLVPQVQILDIDGEVVARVDFVVEGTKVIVEFDGKVKYTDGGLDALFAEKRREDRLRRLGYTVVRVTWADLQSPARVVAWIQSAAAAA
ncbi:type IV toxin-antitoxin system AbiEi family antitoxin domain-containing protein [Knoellia subterranea]|uniref:Uncharacterized protein n=1 Tax=Knoellia subterranea KCTC 19937 TaxID=1385521 RepID=A0A0A0JQ71_9MICO|nr:type IV toxin-antitoxin system AbiEi family antitoxin domain-containing protein [Knoellia subterranea]KGN38879.1 hypothetical protein N803_08620 [Knoellia subterranea KCTC 19937]